MPHLQEVQDKELWDAFQASQSYSQFTQSWTWGEFRIACNCQVRRFAFIDDSGDWLIAVQMEERRRRFGLGYWFAPRGPVFSSKVRIEDRKEIMEKCIEALLEKKELRDRILFWRFEPTVRLSEPDAILPMAFLRNLAQNPACAAVLDLTPDEATLLTNMHSKTRYNIRVAEKHGVKIREGVGEKDLNDFLDLYEATAKRDSFVPQPRDYVRRTFDTMNEAGLARLRLAEFNGKILSANLEIGFGDTIMYLYGSSSDEHREVMAPYALHWSAIRDAKTRGFTLYDFGGANPQSKAMFYYKASWDGITRFKQNWGAKVINLVGTWDLPFNGLIYRLVFIKRFFRG